MVKTMIAKLKYNEARGILISAGSRSAGAAHPVHDDVREHVGKSLLAEAKAEFESRGRGHMTPAEETALQQAGRKMGL
jgi:hypothetical protein